MSWFGGKLLINFMNKILKRFVIAKAFSLQYITRRLIHSFTKTMQLMVNRRLLKRDEHSQVMYENTHVGSQKVHMQTI